MSDAAPAPPDRGGQILAAAAAVFAERGFEGARIAEIAQRAEVSPGHLYNFFDSKAAIIEALIRRETDHYHQRFERFGTAAELFEALLDDVARGPRTPPERQAAVLRMQFIAAAMHDAHVADVMEQSHARLRALVGRLLRAHLCEAGAPASGVDIEARIDLLGALFDGLMLRSLRTGHAPVGESLLHTLRRQLDALSGP